MGKRCLLIICMIFLLLSIFCTAAQTKEIPDRIDFVLRDDFETGELNAWESYPYAEDPGFDPNILCVLEPSYKNSTFSLTGIFEPNDTDYPKDMNLLAMTKKCRIWITSQSVINLAVFLGGDRKAQELRIILCSDDGFRYEWANHYPPANQWLPIKLSSSDFTSNNEKLQPGAKIAAVVIVARYGMVNPHRSYTITLDDFEITGEVERRFTGENPATTWLDKFYVTFLNQHFHRGETLFLHIRPQQGNHEVTLRTVACTVIDSRERSCKSTARLYDDGSHGDTSASDGIWGNDSLYKIKKSDPAGRWRIEIEGGGNNGELIRDTFFFIVPERRLTPEVHPRLFFTADDLPGLNPEMKSPVLQEIFKKSVVAAKNRLNNVDINTIVEGKNINEEYLDGGPFSTTWDDYSNWSRPGYLAATVVESGAFLYTLTGDEEAGMKAKEFMLRFCDFDTWNNPWFNARRMYSYYPVGRWCQGLAVGYDFLYFLMTPVERARVRQALMEKAIIPHYLDHVVNNRLPSHITNHIGMNTTGILLAVIALIGEDSENPCMEPYLSGILAKYKAHIDTAYLPDGSYAEPVGYTSTDTEPLVKGLAAIERNLGIDWTTTTPVKTVYHYAAYNMTEDGLNAPTFGDGGRNYGSGLRRLHLWLARRTGDSLAWGRYLWQNRQFPNSEDFFDYLWMPENLEPRSLSELPTSRWFRSKGNTVFRSGWDGDDLIFVFRCGPHSNHYHLDQGSFWFLYNGEPLITEAGVVNYYRNLYYRSFYIQPIAHNTVLLDAYPESQRIADFDNEIRALDNFPRITSCFTGEIIDAVQGELACVYKERLSTFNRSFVYIKPDYLVLYDELASPDNEIFTWIFHADGTGSISGNGNEVTITRPGTQLRMDILTPHNLSRITRKHVDQDMSFVQLGTKKPSTEAQFVAVMIPSSEENKHDRKNWKTKPVTESGWIGTEVVRNDMTDRIMFKTDPGNDIIPAGDYETDGDRFAVSRHTHGEIDKFWVRNAGIFKVKGAFGEKTLMVSDTKLTIAIDYNPGETAIEADAGEETKISVRLENRPERVLLNGEKMRFSYNRNSGLLTIPVPSGNNRLTVR